MSLAAKLNLQVDSDSSDSDSDNQVDSDKDLLGQQIDSDVEVEVSSGFHNKPNQIVTNEVDSDVEDDKPQHPAAKPQKLAISGKSSEREKKPVKRPLKRPRVNKTPREVTPVSTSSSVPGGIDPAILQFAQKIAKQAETNPSSVLHPVATATHNNAFAPATAAEKSAITTGQSQAILEWPSQMWAMWKSAPSYCARVPGTCLAPSKVPLSTSYEQNFGTKNAFTVDDLFQSRIEKGEPIGLFYDGITFAESNCYLYEKRAFQDWDAEHHHLPVDKLTAPDAESGNQDAIATRLMPPSRNQVTHFLKTVSQFSNKNPGQLVIVASATGYNRAGCLIVAYLVEVMRVPLAKALQDFQAVRPPGIYSPHVLEFLHRCYQGTIPLDVALLSSQFTTPKWESKQSKNVLEAQLSVLEKGSMISKQPSLVVSYRAHSVKSQPVQKMAPQAVPPPNAPPKPVAPEPWKVEWSRSSKRYYFFNPVTKLSVWKLEDCK